MKYAALGALAIGAASAGYYLYDMGLGRSTRATIPTVTQITEPPRQNHPPVANFTRRPFYLNPTDQQTIQFTNKCYDVDNDPLRYSWSVDGQPTSTERDYSTRLSVGDHAIRLSASDGIVEDHVEQRVTIEPDQIYPIKPLRIKYKGMRTLAGWFVAEPEDKMDEQLSTIRNELGCNAVIVFALAPFEDNLIKCATLAMQKGFDRVYVTPDYLDLTIDETIVRLTRFVPRVKALRELSPSIVLMVGHEFGLDMHGIIPGDTWSERLQYQFDHRDWLGMVRAKLPDVFKRIISLCKENYGYQIAYAAAIWEDDLVPWSDPIFESVGTDAYISDPVGWTENWIVEHLSSLSRFGKPVNSMEWGCLTFKGADTMGASADLNIDKYPYDEDAQANYIQRYCQMMNRARVNGCFYTQYNDERREGYGLYDGVRRKKGFYMYKSYQRTS